MKPRKKFPKMNVNLKHPFICHIMYIHTFYCKPAALSDGRIGYISRINGSRSNEFIRKLNDLRRIMLQIHTLIHQSAIHPTHTSSSAIARHTILLCILFPTSALFTANKYTCIHSPIYKIKSIKFNSFSFQQYYNDPLQQQRKKGYIFLINSILKHLCDIIQKICLNNKICE